MKNACLMGVMLFAAAAACAGCSRFPDPPKAPDFSPSKAAQAAMDSYDANHDGRLDAEELKKCPAIKDALARIDTNGDGAITVDELTARMTAWFTMGTIVTSGTAIVRMDNRPLEGALVTFEPEPFLGASFAPCTGTTLAMGDAYVSRANSQFPGIYLGFYRVKISKMVGGKETVPAKYNSQTELGYEAAADLTGIGTVNFNLSSH